MSNLATRSDFLSSFLFYLRQVFYCSQWRDSYGSCSKHPCLLLERSETTVFHLFNICSFHTELQWLSFPCTNTKNNKNLYICVSFNSFSYCNYWSGFCCLFRSPSLTWAVKLRFCGNKSEFLIISILDVLGNAKHRLHNHAVWVLILCLIGQIFPSIPWASWGSLFLVCFLKEVQK